MRTRSQTRNHNRQQQAPPAVVEPFNLEEPFDNPPLVPMADNRTMAELLQAPTEGYEDAIVIPKINAKHGLINLVQNKQFFRHDKEDPHAHIRYFNKITSTMRFPDVPSTSIKLMLFPFSLEGFESSNARQEPSHQSDVKKPLRVSKNGCGTNFEQPSILGKPPVQIHQKQPVKQELSECGWLKIMISKKSARMACSSSNDSDSQPFRIGIQTTTRMKQSSSKLVPQVFPLAVRQLHTKELELLFTVI
ncbi:hypothetical protein Tco_0581326 [Tanacetum coccineum]